MWDKLKELMRLYAETSRDARTGGITSTIKDIDNLDISDEEKVARKQDFALKHIGANLAGISLGTSVAQLGLIPGIATEAGGAAGGYVGYKLGEKADEKFGTKWIAPTLSIVGGIGSGIVAYKGLKPSYNYLAKNGVIGYKDVPEEMLKLLVTKENPVLNVGWAPKQTINIKRAGNLDTMYYPERWDVTNEGANPFGVWLQGKFGIPRTDVTNPGKGAKAAVARKIFADRKQYAGEVTLEKPIQTVGEIPNRSDLSYAAERMGADGIIYNNVYDNGYNNNQVILSFKKPNIERGYKFYEQPSKLSGAEKLGILKGVRNDPKNMSLIHRTDYIEFDDYGNLLIKPHPDNWATQNSVHFTSGRPVIDHASKWSGKDTMIITPFGEVSRTMQPSSIVPMDTFFLNKNGFPLRSNNIKIITSNNDKFRLLKDKGFNVEFLSNPSSKDWDIAAEKIANIPEEKIYRALEKKYGLNAEINLPEIDITGQTIPETMKHIRKFIPDADGFRSLTNKAFIKSELDPDPVVQISNTVKAHKTPEVHSKHWSSSTDYTRGFEKYSNLPKWEQIWLKPKFEAEVKKAKQILQQRLIENKEGGNAAYKRIIELGAKNGIHKQGGKLNNKLTK